ncbi:hypothetical protein [Constantimarinum furrinae]|uniref:Uncharacterized protein n=1 Tax=Constantimarinum furrinae TaxID=2562285 RepID=A0A7G8PWF8_9FLAO|nr:hypothetical protein [Constantimarinum furrinae]QNJ98674.1 hypothetical protein ALE3EI_2127 [Constantimarinum furrinae]
MKTKTIINFYVFLFLVTVSNSGFCQISNPEEVGNKTIFIPNELKSNIEFSNLDRSLTYHSQFIESLNGYVNIVTDSNGLILKITGPNSIDQNILIGNQDSGVVPCPHCLPYHENKACVLVCIFDALFGDD